MKTCIFVDSCPASWSQYKNTKCYKHFVNQLSTWEMSKTHCQSLGAKLAAPGDENEINFLFSIR